MRHFLAIDIGASSGRHILGHRDEDGLLRLEEIFRFDNLQIERGGHVCWDVESLVKSIVAGIKACAGRGIVPESIAIDTWGVDFILLDGELRECCDAVAYRDTRTEKIIPEVEKAIPPEELYARTGIQKMSFNTIYQLAALKTEDPGALDRAEHMLMMPEYLNFRLTGKIVHDYTIASTTALLDAAARDWDFDIIDRLGLPRRIFGKLSMPGAAIGPLSPAVAAEVGFQSNVVLGACHDTASAYLAVPAADDNAVYISSGTWSLLGIESRTPLTTEESRIANFTNEGGYDCRYRYLRNIMGLWMIQSIRRELNGTAYVQGRSASAPEAEPFIAQAGGRKMSFAELESLARASKYDGIVNVNEQRFMAPKSMIAEVVAACADAGIAPPATIGDLVLCVYRSLAECYRKSIAELSKLTGRTFTSINIVGGGCKDKFLNELTSGATGLEVIAGPSEGTAVGNLIVQMLAAGVFSSVEDARAAIVKA